MDFSNSITTACQTLLLSIKSLDPALPDAEFNPKAKRTADLIVALASLIDGRIGNEPSSPRRQQLKNLTQVTQNCVLNFIQLSLKSRASPDPDLDAQKSDTLRKIGACIKEIVTASKELDEEAQRSPSPAAPAEDSNLKNTRIATQTQQSKILLGHLRATSESLILRDTGQFRTNAKLCLEHIVPWESEFNGPHTSAKAKWISEEVRKAVKTGTLLFMRPDDAQEFLTQFERAMEQIVTTIKSLLVLSQNPAPPYPGDDVYDVQVIYDEESSESESEDDPIGEPVKEPELEPEAVPHENEEAEAVDNEETVIDKLETTNNEETTRDVAPRVASPRPKSIWKEPGSYQPPKPSNSPFFSRGSNFLPHHTLLNNEETEDSATSKEQTSILEAEETKEIKLLSKPEVLEQSSSPGSNQPSPRPGGSPPLSPRSLSPSPHDDPEEPNETPTLKHKAPPSRLFTSSSPLVSSSGNSSEGTPTDSPDPSKKKMRHEEGHSDEPTTPKISRTGSVRVKPLPPLSLPINIYEPTLESPKTAKSKKDKTDKTIRSKRGAKVPETPPKETVLNSPTRRQTKRSKKSILPPSFDGLPTERKEFLEKIVEVFLQNDEGFNASFAKKSISEKESLIKILAVEVSTFELAHNIRIKAEVQEEMATLAPPVKSHTSLDALFDNPLPNPSGSMSARGRVESTFTGLDGTRHSPLVVSNPTATPNKNATISKRSKKTKGEELSVSVVYDSAETSSGSASTHESSDSSKRAALKTEKTSTFGTMLRRTTKAVQIKTLQFDSNDDLTAFGKELSTLCLRYAGFMNGFVTRFEKNICDTPTNLQVANRENQRLKEEVYKYTSNLIKCVDQILVYTMPSGFIEHNGDDTSALYKAIMRANEQISSIKEMKSKMSAPIVPLDNAKIVVGRYAQLIQLNLLTSVNISTTAVISVISQMMTSVHDQRSEPNNVVTQFNFFALISSFFKQVCSSLSDIETIFYISNLAALADTSALRKPDGDKKGRIGRSESIRELDKKTKAEAAKDKKEEPNPNFIWEESAESDDVTTLFQSAPIMDVLSRMTPTHKPQNEELLAVWEITSSTFLEADQFIDLVIDRWATPKTMKKDVLFTFQFGLLKLLHQWVIRNSFLLDSECRTRLTEFLTTKVPKKDKKMEAKVAELLADIQAERFELPPNLCRKVPSGIVAFGCAISPFQPINVFDEREIADYLTGIDTEIYKRISSSELLSQSWMNPERACLARNVIDYIQRANAISFWVGTCILEQPKLKIRVQVLTKIIDLAQHLREMNNYNSLMGVIAGLNTSAISRLKLTFAGLKARSQEALDSLQDLMNPTKSFQKLRESISVAGKAVLPYVGMHLSDLAMIDEGNKNWITREDGMPCVNLYKQQLICTNIKKLLQYQQTLPTSSEFQSGPLYSFLFELARLEENELYTLSLEREPRTA